MTESLTDQIEAVAEIRGEDPAKVIAEALKTGLDKLHTDVVLGAFLRGDISRGDAIERLGPRPVELAELQAEFVEADVKWGLNG